MKHLKKFNEDNSMLYYPILLQEFNKLWMKSSVNSMATFNSLKNRIKSGYNISFSDPTIVISKEELNFGDRRSVQIYEIEDKWFVAKLNSGFGMVSYFKCDDTDGLLELLKDIL